MMFLDFFYFSRPIDRKRQVRVYVATDGNFRNHSNNSDPCLTKISTLISGNILLEQYQYLAIYCWAISISILIFGKLQYQYQYWKSDWFVSLPAFVLTPFYFIRLKTDFNRFLLWKAWMKKSDRVDSQKRRKNQSIIQCFETSM